MDIEKLISGHEQIKIHGRCNTDYRRKLAEEAIAYFQEHPKPDRVEAFGVKNYAGFGDQRCDCRPGYGPRHGSIVYEIDYKRGNENFKIDESGIYLIMTSVANPTINVGKLIKIYLEHKEKMELADNELKRLTELNIDD